MSQDQHRHRRSHYFIKKDFQFRFILKFCILVLVGVIISTCLLFVFSRGTLTSSFKQSRLIIEDTASAILPAVIWTNLITLGLITIATIAITLFVSHKIAGPIFRFEKEIDLMAEGDLTRRIRLRKKDQMAVLAEGLDKMSSSLQEKVLCIHSEIDRLAELAAKQDASNELIEALNILKQNVRLHFKT